MDKVAHDLEIIKSSDRDDTILGYIFQFFSLCLSTYCFYNSTAFFDRDATLIAIPYSVYQLNLTGLIFGSIAFFLDLRKSSAAKTYNAQMAKGNRIKAQKKVCSNPKGVVSRKPPKFCAPVILLITKSAPLSWHLDRAI